jgi:hypothetical protein
MKTWVRKTLSVGVLAAGALLFGSGIAHADTKQDSWDNNGIANGTQIVAPVSETLNLAGLGVGILGEGNGMGLATSGHSTEGGKVHQNSGDNNGILNGTQIYLPIDLTNNVAGIGVGVLGEGNGQGAAVDTESARVEHGNKKVKQDSSDNNGILNGTQVYLPIDVVNNVAGVGLGILGEGNGAGAAVSGHQTESGKAKKVSQDSSDNNGILNGTQVYAPIDVTNNVAGIGLGILGEGNGAGAAVDGGHSTEGADQASSDNNGILNGTQIIAPIDVDNNICGIGVGILGEGNGQAICATDVKGGGHDGGHDGDDDGDGGDDDDVDGDNGTDDDYGDEPRSARGTATTEQSPISDVTSVTDGVKGGGGLLGGLLGSLR